ncbi:MAG: hypothetical protein AAF658_09560, partial [Myxococcota bacterium]
PADASDPELVPLDLDAPDSVALVPVDALRPALVEPVDEKTAWYEEWWVWTAGGAAVVAAVATTVVLSSGGGDDSETQVDAVLTTDGEPSIGPTLPSLTP